MNDKILFFIQSVYDLGTAHSIKQKLECDLYSLIDFNKYIKKFYQEQQLVNFQKVWYFRDHIKNLKRKPDLSYLSSFEKKYGINLWHIAYMDRNFYKFNTYHKFSSDEILLVLEQECKLFEEILDEVSPDFLIISIPDYNQSQLLFELCRAKGIKILMLNHIGRLGYRCFISERSDIIDNFEEIIKNYSNSVDKTIEELQSYSHAYSKQTFDVIREIRTSMWKKLKGSLRYIFVVANDEYRQYYVNFGRTRTRVLINEGFLFLRKIYRESFIKKYLAREIDKETLFVYFPLHVDPEQSTLMGAPFYTDQLNVIANIAKSLPIGYKLFVKEHPAQVTYGWRDVSYYKTILSMPNVKLFHHSVSNDEILKNCAMVITIAGTLGLEAAFYKKPTIVFTDTLYSGLPSIYRLRSIEELPQAIHSSLNKKIDLSDLNKFVNCIIENSFEYDFSKIEIPMQNRFFPGGFFFDVDIPHQEMISFLKENDSIFDKLSSEYIKKINQHKKI